MKKYTFYTKKTNNNTTPSNNYSKILSDIISANILKANPYFEEITPKKTKNFNIEIEIEKKPTYTFEDDQYEGILKAIDLFYSGLIDENTYDFKLPDGTPVKKFGNEIQIGLDLIPLNKFTEKIYEYLKDMNKKKIYEFYINLPKKTKKEINILIA